MAQFKTLTREQIEEFSRRRNGPGVVDLTEYKGWIDNAIKQSEGWGSIDLEPSDNVRAIKRRTTIAGKEMNRIIKWHRKSTPQQLIFRAIEPNQVVKRSRTRRQQAS